MLKALGLLLISLTASAGPLVQSNDIVTQAYLTSKGGAFSQLPNSAQLWNDIDS